MTLKDDYYTGSTGLQTQLDNSFDAGVALITANRAAISSALIAAAAAGNVAFVVTLTTSYLPDYLRLKGLLLKAYLCGISSALAVENVYAYECVPTLNTSDNMSTRIDLNFTFATT